jgi:hypothetical protein
MVVGDEGKTNFFAPSGYCANRHQPLSKPLMTGQEGIDAPDT